MRIKNALKSMIATSMLLSTLAEARQRVAAPCPDHPGLRAVQASGEVAPRPRPPCWHSRLNPFLVRDPRFPECTEAVTRGGEAQPCDKRAVALRHDTNLGGIYAVCAYHARSDMVPLAYLLDNARAGGGDVSRRELCRILLPVEADVLEVILIAVIRDWPEATATGKDGVLVLATEAAP